MKYLFLIVFFSVSNNLIIDGWKPGKTDSKGNLIIVELHNRKDVKDRPLHEIISVDTEWSVLIRYNDYIQNQYYIFNNKKKQVFKTESFDVFIKEIKKIPDNTLVRKIGKCSVPYDYLMPEDLTDIMNSVFREKNCILEENIMFCYCLTEKMIYPNF